MDETSRDCPDLADLSALHDGECDAAERSRLEEHVAGCPGCRGALSALGAADVWVREADPGRGAEFAIERFVERVSAARRARLGAGYARSDGGGRRRIVRGILVASASVAAVFVLSLLLPPAAGPGGREGHRGGADVARTAAEPAGTRNAEADVSGKPGPAAGSPAGRPAPSGSGMRTLVRIDEGWPRRCREEARRVLEERGPSFDGSAEALAEVLERVRPLGRFALPALRDAVRDDRVPVSLLGFEVLLRLPFDTSLEDLVAAGRRHGRMEQVLDAIERAGSPRSVSWLVELSREGAPLRRRALEVLAAIPGRDALDALADLAVNADEDRAPDPDAVAAIASRTGPESLRILLDLYRTSGGDPVLELALRSRAKEARSWVRRTLAGPPSGELDVAIELAGVLEDRGTVASLLGLLHEDRWRREAIRSLFRIGDPRSLPDVLARLDPEGEDARSMTAAARSIGPATLAALAEHAVRKKGATGRNATILLGHVGPRGIPHLAAVLRSGNHAEEASSALARLDTEPSREVLAEGLADPLRGDRLLEMLIDRGHGELAIALLRTLVEEGGGSRTRHALARLERARGSPPPAAPE